jgi:hypothetical protein
MTDRHVAFWHIANLLAAHPRYRQVSFGNISRVQQAIALGNYCCLGDGKTIRAVATWRGINVAVLLRTHPRYPVDSVEPTDGMFLTSLAALDQESLKTMIRHLRMAHADKDVYWDRHNGKLGHRPRKSPLQSPPQLAAST